MANMYGSKRWPKRSFWVDGDAAIREVDSQGDAAKAVVTLKFSVQNGQKSVGGSCEDTILIRDVSWTKANVVIILAL
jgi:hypothetical protein